MFHLRTLFPERAKDMLNSRFKSKPIHKIAAVALVMMFTFLLPACAGNNENGQPVDNSNTQQTVKEAPTRKPHQNVQADPEFSLTPSPTYRPIEEDNICEDKVALYDVMEEWEITVESAQIYEGDLPESDFPPEFFGSSSVKNAAKDRVFLLLMVEFHIIKQAEYSETEHFISDINVIEANNMDQPVGLSYIQALDSTIGRSDNLEKDFYRIYMAEGDRGKAYLGFLLPEGLASSSELYLSVGHITLPESVHYIPLSDMLDAA